jgi:hypothetical protein
LGLIRFNLVSDLKNLNNQNKLIYLKNKKPEKPIFTPSNHVKEAQLKDIWIALIF